MTDWRTLDEITHADEREQVRREEMAALARRAEPGGTVWSRFHFCEVLPEPTPLTWSIMQELLSGRGGYGAMYRDLGFTPHPSLDHVGAYDLVAGRTYCNLSREPRFYRRVFPFEHPFAVLKADPTRALHPRAVLQPANLGPLFWLMLPFRLPFILLSSVRFLLRLNEWNRTFADRFRQEIVPVFVEEVTRAEQQDLSALSAADLLEQLELWIRRTLHDFARDSLKPAVLASLAANHVESVLRRKVGPQGAADAVRILSMGIHPDPGTDLLAAITDVQAGRMELSVFLAQFGHRGLDEMELSRPRWAETPEHLFTLSQPQASSAPPPKADQSAQSREQVIHQTQLSQTECQVLEPHMRAMQTYQGLRETGKHHLMRGQALIRALLLELDRRYQLEDGIFYLTREELPALVAGEDLRDRIARRRHRRTLALSLEVPPVLFSDDVEAVGRPFPIPQGDHFRGVGLSAGEITAPALVLDTPAPDAIPPGPYILVCPATDPAWVLLFPRARALVMETGGVLSHGAILAREFGLPAVAGPFHTGPTQVGPLRQRISTGQLLRIDGGQGTVTLVSEE